MHRYVESFQEASYVEDLSNQGYAGYAGVKA